MKRYLSLLAVGIWLSLSSCSFFSSSPEDAASDEQTALSESSEDVAPSTGLEEEPPAPAKAAKSERDSTVELLWQVPTEAVEKYHIHYGLEPDHLDNHIEIPVSELEKIDHPKHGPVYRYELKEIPAGRAIYLSLSAENKYGISDASNPTKVEPGQRSVTP